LAFEAGEKRRPAGEYHDTVLVTHALFSPGERKAGWFLDG